MTRSCHTATAAGVALKEKDVTSKHCTNKNPCLKPILRWLAEIGVKSEALHNRMSQKAVEEADCVRQQTPSSTSAH